MCRKAWGFKSPPEHQTQEIRGIQLITEFITFRFMVLGRLLLFIFESRPFSSLSLFPNTIAIDTGAAPRH